MIMAGLSFFGRKCHKVGFNFAEPSEARQTYGGG
jgi:hypothetical protein